MSKTGFMYAAHSIAGQSPPWMDLSVRPLLVLLPGGTEIDTNPGPSAGVWWSETSVTTFGVKPMNQADLFSFVVPVLPAMGRSSGLTQSFAVPDCTTCCMA